MPLVPNLILSWDQFKSDWSVSLVALGRKNEHQDGDQRVQATHCEGEMHCELSRRMKHHSARPRHADPHLLAGMSCLKGEHISTSIGEER